MIKMKKKSKLYYLPVTLVELVKTKPESTLFLLIKLYEKAYPDAKVEKYYDAIQTYLSDIEFELEEVVLKPTTPPKPEEIN